MNELTKTNAIWQLNYILSQKNNIYNMYIYKQLRNSIMFILKTSPLTAEVLFPQKNSFRQEREVTWDERLELWILM